MEVPFAPPVVARSSTSRPAPAGSTGDVATTRRAPLAPLAPSPVAGLSPAQWESARLEAARWHAARQAVDWQACAHAAQGQAGPWAAPSPWSAPAMGPSTRHRRWAAIVATLVLLALVAAGAAVVVLGRDRGAADTSSFRAAIVDADQATSLTYELDMTSPGQPDIHATAAIDLDRHVASMRVWAAGERWDYVMDMAAAVVYVDSGPLADEGYDVGDAEWVSVELEGEVPSESLTGVYGLGENPLDATQLFDAADSVEDEGWEDVAGEQARHYRVTLDEAVVLGESDASGVRAVAHDPHRSGFVNDGQADPEGKIVYDVYVNARDQIVRLSFAAKVADQWVSVDLSVTSIDEPVDIEIPRPSTVVSADDIDL